MRYWTYYVDLAGKWALVDNERPLNRIVGMADSKAEAEAWVTSR